MEEAKDSDDPEEPDAAEREDQQMQVDEQVANATERESSSQIRVSSVGISELHEPSFDIKSSYRPSESMPLDQQFKEQCDLNDNVSDAGRDSDDERVAKAKKQSRELMKLGVSA